MTMSFPNRRQNIAFTLIVINIVGFFIIYLRPQLIRYLAIYPSGLLRERMIWTPVTYMFVHGGFNHLLFNMLFLVFVAPSVESRMGTREFAFYYIIVGALAGLFSVFAYMASSINVPIVGASGALYGVLLAFATYFPRARFMVFYILPMRAPLALALFAGIDIVMHLMGGSGTAHLTHLSGLMFGYLYFVIRKGINPVKEMMGKGAG